MAGAGTVDEVEFHMVKIAHLGSPRGSSFQRASPAAHFPLKKSLEARKQPKKGASRFGTLMRQTCRSSHAAAEREGPHRTQERQAEATRPDAKLN